MRYLVVVPGDTVITSGMTILPAPLGAVTVMGDGACIEEARMVVVDFPGAEIWDTYLLEVVAVRQTKATGGPGIGTSHAQAPNDQVARDVPARQS
jgi:hypothetical protein